MPVSVLGLDADDTLWHNETFYRLTRQRFNELLSDFVDAERLEEEIVATEKRNLSLYGYGAKGFTLSMLETALEVSKGKVSGQALSEILAVGRELMNHPVEPLPGVHEALEALSAEYRLVLITKGDLFHQESKLAASSLGHFFSGVEIVSEKRAETYARIFSRHGAGARRDGRQLRALGRSARARSRQLRRPHPLPPRLGSRGRAAADIASPLRGAAVPCGAAAVAGRCFRLAGNVIGAIHPAVKGVVAEEVLWFALATWPAPCQTAPMLETKP
jgi:putative hydrolase of the HAD superfamily